MARRRTFLPRPHDSLAAAAAKHQAIAASHVQELEEPAPAEPATQTDTERRPRKRQARDKEGRFK